MKKLFALVMTLALVFAIAAPAMAASWSNTNNVTGTGMSVDVMLLQVNSGITGTYYTEFNGTVTAGAPVVFRVSVTVPVKAEVDAYYGTGTPNITGTISVSNITVYNILEQGALLNGSASNNLPTGLFTSSTTFKAAEMKGSADKDYAATYYAIYSGVVNGAGDATVTASVGYNASSSVGNGIIKGDYKILKDGIQYPSNASSYTNADYALKFSLDSNKIITGWQFYYDGTAYDIYNAYGSTTGALMFKNGTNEYTSGTVYNYMLSAYTNMINVLGFKYGDRVIFSESNILAFFGGGGKTTDTATYKAYGSVIPTPVPTTPGSGGSINVPNTGDSVSVLGFVMVGLALLATAAVIVKKVRA